MHCADSVIEFASLRRSPPEDRELGPFFDSPGERAASVRDGEIKGQMVECAAEVEEAFADKSTPLD
jgi:hypothetical protein